MEMTEKNLRLLAKFFYKSRNYTAWWASPLLLGIEELKSFDISIAEAEVIFQAFVQKGFLKKHEGGPTQVDGVLYSRYLFDLAHIKELREYANTPFWYSWFSESWLDRIEKLKTFFIVSFVLIVTAFLQGFLGKFGEAVYAFIKGIFGCK